ncbi:MAG: Ycf51 family protein [Cyanobacteria bacterium P01_A01_bin.105]
MPLPETFLDATQWMGIATVALALVSALAFFWQWGIRFRLVGATGFSLVLTAGLFGLSFDPVVPVAVEGAIPYTTVFDSGASQIVIRVPQTVTASELEATLQQAARNLLRASRLGQPGRPPTIRARTIVHRPGGISDLLYLGQVQPNRSGDDTSNNNPPDNNPYIVELDLQQLQQANDAA